MLQRLWNSRKNSCPTGGEADRGFFVVVFDRLKNLENLSLNEEFLLKFPDEGCFERFAFLKLSSGKFPKAAETLSLGSLGEKEPPRFVLNDSANDGNHIAEKLNKNDPLQLQKILQHLLPVLGEDGFGVELDPVDW